MTAEQAIRVTTEKAITTEEIIKEISNTCNNGRRFSMFIGIYLNIDVMKEVMDLGYKISLGVNPFGENYIKIEW